MPDDILALAKFYLPVQSGRMATEQHVTMSLVAAVHVVESDADNPGTNESQGLFDCHEG